MIKKLLFTSFLLIHFITSFGQNEYYFPAGVAFNQSIQSPEEFLGYPIGEFHTRHDRIVSYLEYLAENSELATFQTIGQTYEQRPQVVLTITSKENHDNLEQIRQDHLKLSDPSSTSNDITSMPAVITLGYSVHGNEPSSAEAALLTAYYLVAGEGEEISSYRENAITFIDPVYNPDGRDRHTNWANMHRGEPKVADSWDREHNEVWPSGRVNHYWFDLNRDWLPLVHPESKARVEFYHQWLPNMVTDFHEMGTNSTYFFEPTKPFGSENPRVPRSNYDQLNPLMAKYFASAMDEIGSLYFTKEVYDNSYPGYGSTYPDIHGGLGIVFEQASSRGHLQESSTKDVSFSFTIRNHLRSSLATIKGTVENKNTFLNHQKEFFQSSLREGQSDPVKAYAFGERYDKTRLDAFIDLLLRHKIKVYRSNQPVTIDGQSYSTGESYMVPTGQVQYRMVKSVFEKVKSFQDSVFYDASAWSMALAFGIPHREMKGKSNLGGQVLGLNDDKVTFTKSNYAYIADWRDLNTSKALYHLLKNDVFVHTAQKPFSSQIANTKIDFSYGSLMVSVADQNKTADEVHELVKEASEISGVPFHPVNSGTSLSGIDLGSRNFRTVSQPKAMMIVGEGVYLYEAGEVWHLLDTRVGMPITKVDKVDLPRVNLANYNTIVMVNGNYNDLQSKWVDQLRGWVANGGTLITQKSATSWAIKQGISKAQLKETEPKEEGRKDYVTAREVRGSQRVGGSIYEIDLDVTHPIGYGFSSRKLMVYRNSTIYLKPSENSFSTVGQYTNQPWVSGFVSKENVEKIKNSASIVVTNSGRGRVINFTDNPNFRGHWLGTSRLFLNAVFFGDMVRVP